LLLTAVSARLPLLSRVAARRFLSLTDKSQLGDGSTAKLEIRVRGWVLAGFWLVLLGSGWFWLVLVGGACWGEHRQ